MTKLSCHCTWQLPVLFVFELFFLDGLMQSSHERKYVGFQVCGSLLPSLTAQEVGVVFSPNLLGCLVNNCHSSENYLHSAAKHLVSYYGDALCQRQQHVAGLVIVVSCMSSLILYSDSELEKMPHREEILFG